MQIFNNQLLANVSRFGLAMAIIASTLGQADAQINFQLTDQEPVVGITSAVVSPVAERATQTIHRYALDQSGNLTGQVTVAGDIPSNLGVYMMQNNAMVYQATTNSMGEFTVMAIKPGRYSLVIAGRNQLAAQGIMIERNATPATKDFIQLSTIQTAYKGVQDLVATSLPREISTNLGTATAGTRQVSATLSDVPTAQQVRIINGKIKGQIISLINDINITGTTVHLLQNSKPVAQVEVDEAGMFIIPDTDAGIYDLVATADSGMAAMRIEAIGSGNPMKMISYGRQVPTELSVPLAEDCPCGQVQTVVQADQVSPVSEPIAMEAASHSPVEYASESIGCGGSCGGCCGSAGNFANSTGSVLGPRGGGGGVGGGFLGGSGGGFLGGSGGGLAGGAAGISRLLSLAALGGAITALADDDDEPASNASN